MFKWFKHKKNERSKKHKFKISYCPDHKSWFLYKKYGPFPGEYSVMEAARTLEDAENKLKIYVDGLNVEKRFYDKDGNLI